ncbi:MAG: MBL fold metallo-hydrolase [Desulfobacterales bacterium]|jgi:ribonuclease BN (tRNA processing enzyme)
MQITCWGSRGSIPVSGKSYLKYGGDTTSLEIRTKSGDIIAVDAGTGIRRFGNKLVEENALNINFLFTHAHWDHLMGFPFFKPLYAKNAHLLMHGCPFHSQFIETILSTIMAPPNFPVKYADVKAQMTYERSCPQEFSIGSVSIIPIPISHPNGGSGYKFIEDDRTFVFLTDNELGYRHTGGRPFQDYVNFAAGADLLIHDSEYTPEEYQTFIEWGHSEYKDVLKLAQQAGVKKLGLFHINQERTDEQMDDMVSICQQHLDERGLQIECVGVATDMIFNL